MWKFSENNLGEFIEKTYKKTFTYRVCNNHWGLSHGLKHEIDVLDGIRCGNISKTRAYIAVDEDEHGKPILETWILSKHNQYERV